MSGVIPPSILTYNFPFKLNNPEFVTIAFPFSVRIDKIWFTGNNDLYNGVAGDWFESGRGIKLAAWKTRNTKIQHGQYDAPSDMTAFFGCDVAKPYLAQADENLKPTMWLGNPDDSIDGMQANNVAFVWNQMGFRSTAKSAPELNDPANTGWTNPSWNEGEFNQYSYKTDLSIMQIDEMLSVFPYKYTGNWDDYSDNAATIQIHVAYTGIWVPDLATAPEPVWTDWWND